MSAESNVAAYCGISRRRLDVQENTYVIRLTVEDVKGQTDKNGQPIKPGVYSCGEEMYAKFRPIVAARLLKTQMIDANGKPVVDDDGKPIMVITAEHEAHGNRLL